MEDQRWVHVCLFKGLRVRVNGHRAGVKEKTVEWWDGSRRHEPLRSDKVNADLGRMEKNAAVYPLKDIQVAFEAISRG